MMEEEGRELIQNAFLKCSYVRMPSPTRAQEGYAVFKKGFEVRLVVANAEELARLREAIACCGFRLASHFEKAGRMIQPIYGREIVEWRARWLGLKGPVEVFRGFGPTGDAPEKKRPTGVHLTRAQSRTEAEAFLAKRSKQPLPEHQTLDEKAAPLRPFSRPRKPKSD